MQGLRDQALLNVQVDVQQVGQDLSVGIQQIQEDLTLDSLVWASQVGLDTGKKCLDGTRTEILNEILDWMNSPNPVTPPIFWLYGQAGRGKSAIAHMIALHAQNLGMFGSCFCFSRTRQHERLHVKLFTTIARDLADHDLHLWPILAKGVTNNHSLRDTADITEQ